MNNKFAITIDLDWAPDYAIDYTIELFVKNNIKATWFITHDSPSVQKLFQYSNLFDIGIHPNFMENSTHGKTYEDVMQYMMTIVPNAKIVRTHGLFQSSNIIKMMVDKFGIEIDLSIFLWETSHIQSHTISYQDSGKKLIRIPYFWAEEEAMSKKESFCLTDKTMNTEGIKIFNFHPIHIYLNSSNFIQYQNLKSKTNYPKCLETVARKFKNTEDIGVNNFLLILIDTQKIFCKITELEDKNYG